MAANQEVIIEIITRDKASGTILKVEKQIEKMGKSATSSNRKITDSTETLEAKLDSLGNRFRYLSLVTGIITGGMIGLVRGFVTAAAEAQNAQMKIGVFAASMGHDFNEANEIAKNLAKTGLVSITEASAATANILATGLGLDKTEKLLKGMLDTAVTSKEILNDTFGQALIKSSLGVRILQERQVDAIGINFQMRDVWKEYGKEIGKTTAEMSTQEKQMATINYLLKETQRFTGAASLATDTLSGSMSKLGATSFMTKASIGSAMAPIIGGVTDVLTRASEAVGEFADRFPVATTAIITGTLTLSALGTAFAAVGALVPMLTRGIKDVRGALAKMTIASVVAAAKFLLIAAAVGVVIVAIAKLVGVWDSWMSKIDGLRTRIQETIDQFKMMGEEGSEAADDITKKLKDLTDAMTLVTRDYKEGLREWVDKHDETISSLEDQIQKLEKAYSKSTKSIRDDFKDTMRDMEISHTRRKEDLQRELDEEVSKGIWADQTRIRDLRLRLQREDEDYANSSKQKEDLRDEELESEKEKHDESLAELQKKLDDELALEQKHAELLSEARTWPILDEIEKRTRAYEERIQQLRGEQAEITKTAVTEIGALSGVQQALAMVGIQADNTSTKVQNTANKIQRLRQEAEQAQLLADRQSTTAGRAGLITQNVFTSGWNTVMDQLGEGIYQFWSGDNVNSMLQSSSMGSLIGGRDYGFKNSSIYNWTKDFLGFKDGGVVPGNPSQPIPIMAHGGETVLPYGVAPVTVNINNPTVRSDYDVQNLAKAVSDVLSKQQVYRHLK